MPFHNNIPPLVQRALAAYIRSQSLTFLADFAGSDDDHIHEGLFEDTAIVPWVLCECKHAHCENTQEGNWLAKARVELRESKDRTSAFAVDADDHFTHAGELFSIFAVSAVQDALSAALTNFQAQLVVRTDCAWTVEGRLWVSSLDMDIYCCGTDLA